MTRRSYQYQHRILNTDWGWVGLLGSDQGLRRTTLPQLTSGAAVDHLGFETNQSIELNGIFPAFEEWLRNFTKGLHHYLEVPLDLRDVPPFYKSVWTTCREIPVGETRSYTWVARASGRPKAVRAVGQAMAKNSLPLVVPCHRVIGNDGGLHGFAGGLGLKRWLLEFESGIS